MKECPDCGKPISRSATTCPNCGRTFTPLSNIIIAIILGVLLFFLLGLG